MKALNNITIKAALCLTFAAAVILMEWSCSKEIEKEKPFIEISHDSSNVSEGNPYWDWADKFPGTVSSSIERAGEVKVTVKGGYAPFAFAPDTAALQSTGLYAAGGEHIKIEVPEGVNNLYCQIGLGHKLLDGQLRRRYYNVVKRIPLHSGANDVMSYFGGFLYFCWPPSDVPSGDIELTVSGAIESDDFILGVTNKIEWMERMQERAALIKNPSENEDSMAFLHWTELRSDKLILTAGVKEMSAMQDPEKLLENYGKTVDSYYSFAGLDQTNQMPMRVYTDIQLPDANQTVSKSASTVDFYGQYPIGYLRGQTDAATVWEEKILNPYYAIGIGDPSDNSSFIRHLLGFCAAVQTNWQKSELLNWPTGKMSQRFLIAREGNIIQNDEIDYEDVVRNLNKEYSRTGDSRFMYKTCNEMARTVMLMQLCQEYGWNMFPYLCKRCRELGFDYDRDNVILDQAADDFFVMSMCEYSGKNLYPFFKAWSFPCSEPAIRYMKNFEPIDEDEKFWTAYNPAKTPVFDERTPVLDFQRPTGSITFSMPDADDQSNWFLDGILYDVDKSTASQAVYKRQANSLYNTDWLKAFDGDITKGIQVLGHCQNKTNDTYANIPICYLSFAGPEALKDITAKGELTLYTGSKPANTNLKSINIWIPASTDLSSYRNEPLTFNTLLLVNSNQYFMTSYFYDIEYWDMDAKQWKPTSPDEFLLAYTHVYEPYYFDETYTTTRIRYKMQPITPGTSGYSICEYNEMNFGLVSEGSPAK